MRFVGRIQSPRLVALLRVLPAIPLVVTSGREARRLAPGIDLVPWERVVAGELDLF